MSAFCRRMTRLTAIALFLGVGWLPACVDLRECDCYQDCQKRFGGMWSVVCKDGSCVKSDVVKLGESDETQKVNCLAPDQDEDKAVLQDSHNYLVATLLPVGGTFDWLGKPMQAAAELAIEEFNRVGGIDGRKFGLLRCDTAGDVKRGTAAARFLVEDVGVKAIVGPAFSGVALNVAQNVTIPNGVLTISPSASSPAITDLADNDLVWRTVPSDALQGKAMAALLRSLTQTAGLQRVLIAFKGDAYGRGLSGVLKDELGADSGITLEELEYADPGDATQGFDPTQVAAEIAGKQDPAHDPQMVVLIGTSEVYEATDTTGNTVNGLIFQTEKQWSNTLATHSAPILWVVSEGGKNDRLMEMLDALPAAEGNPADLAGRLFGTAPGSLEAKNRSSFEQRFIAFSGYQKLEVYAPEAYDAMYLIGYLHATLDSSSGTYSGVDLVAGMPSLTSGTVPIDIGAPQISSVAEKLHAGQSILIAGASGVLHFDAKGDPPGAIDFYWVIQAPEGGFTYQSKLFMWPDEDDPQLYQQDPTAIPVTELPHPYPAN